MFFSLLYVAEAPEWPGGKIDIYRSETRGWISALISVISYVDAVGTRGSNLYGFAVPAFLHRSIDSVSRIQ
jgi:hypothetical protein